MMSRHTVASNDGLHGMRERSGRIALAKGRHAISVTMFEKGGGEGLQVRWQGPGVPKQVIPAERLFRAEK